jgi:DNA-binding SARP family transcriptional activator
VPVARGLLRPRLVAALDRLLDVRICAVVAPPGSGKTTALVHWARQAPTDVLWWRADPGAADPVTAVRAGLGAALSSAGHRLPAVPDEASLVAALDGHQGPIVLILDDFHLVGTDPVGALVERLLLATGDHVHLVIGSRVIPPLNLARSELASHLVGSSDLRFRPFEVAELFRLEYRVPLGPDDARELTRHTEGWAAALRLFHHGVAARGPHARHRGLAGLGDGAGYARDYITRTFLADLDTADLMFLQRTAPFESLVGGFCDRLLARTNSEETIARLVRRGVLIPLEDGRGFALPRVLRHHLLAVTTTDAGPRATAQAFRSVAGILTDAIGSTVPTTAPEAARAWAAGGGWPDALTVLSESWDSVLADPDLAWLDAAPPEIRAHPIVRAARAEHARRDGRLEAALELLEEGPPPAAAVPAATAAAITRFCRTWTTGDLQPGGHWSEYLRAAVRRPNPDRRTPLPRQQRDVLAALELTISGNLTGARRLLAQVAGRVTEPVLGCVADLLGAGLHPDEPDRADAVALLAEDLGFPWFARMAHALTHVDDPEVVGAEVSAADDRGDRWGALLLILAGALGDLRAGRPASAAFDDAARRCRELDAPALEAWARSGQAISSVAANLPDALREAESAVGFAHSAQVPGAVALAHLALARCRDEADEPRRIAERELDRLGIRQPAAWGVAAVAAAEGAPGRATVVRRAPVDVRCFGRFELLVDGVRPDLQAVRPRARALLRLLALHAGQPTHREVIADAMWPQLDAAAALHNLHVCVSGLRAVLEPGAARGASRLLVRDGERYLLALPQGSVSDLRTFDARTAAAESAYAAGAIDTAIADLEAALALYVGEVLPEDGPTEWVLSQREHYQGRAAEAAAQLGRLHLEQQRPEEAAAAARRSIDVDPFRDGSWRLLIAAHDAAGNLAEAEEARRSYADVLASLGVASQAATSFTRHH